MTCTAKTDPAAECPWRGEGWQPIETAPKGVEHNGKKAMSWMMLSWPDGEGGYHVESGMRVGDQFFAAPTFYSGGPFDGKQYTLREVEVFPTHWMPLPAPPGAAVEPAALSPTPVDASQASDPVAKPAALTVAEAARVLMEAHAHTLPNVTRAAAREFGPLGFVDAAAVVGAALRALTEEGKP